VGSAWEEALPVAAHPAVTNKTVSKMYFIFPSLAFMRVVSCSHKAVHIAGRQ
jgi:hypothetical protein